eukprot:TRINITY_DN5969_c0_g2_i2.p2 TRINITY_DN5969_c0_g2~~TRINITY_DN5969_c0_g2_i2.p2  ORF type:complete len:273 (-),score=65.37 TRINITY_DN5969_c0_g2_i2:37-855(-)
MPEWSIAIVLTILLAPLASVRDISVFASCHIMADVLIMFSAVTIVVCCIISIAKDGVGTGFTHSTSVFSSMKLIGLSTSAYEINAVLIPVHLQAKNKEEYHKAQYPAIISVCVLYLTIGLFGYLAFGSEVKGPLTLSLDQSLWYVIAIELIYIVALIPTIIIQIYPAVTIVVHYFVDGIASESRKERYQLLVRMLMIAVPIWLAVIFGKNFGTVLAFVGNLVCAPMSYVFPGLIHYLVAADKGKDKLRDIALICFGVTCCIIATILSFFDFA